MPDNFDRRRRDNNCPPCSCERDRDRRDNRREDRRDDRRDRRDRNDYWPWR